MAVHTGMKLKRAPALRGRKCTGLPLETGGPCRAKNREI